MLAAEMPARLGSPSDLCARFAENCGHVHAVERNSNGTEIRFVTQDAVIVLPEEGSPVRYSKPNHFAWLDDGHVFAGQASSVQEPLTLASGDRIPSAAYPHPFDWSRRFLLTTDPSGCSIVRAERGAPVVAELPQPCRRLFGQGTSLFVIGDRRERTEIVVQSFRDAGDRLVPAYVRTLRRLSGKHSPFFVTDVSLDGSILCVQNVYDPPIWFLAPAYLVAESSAALERLPFSYWADEKLFLSERLALRLSAN